MAGLDSAAQLYRYERKRTTMKFQDWEGITAARIRAEKADQFTSVMGLRHTWDHVRRRHAARLYREDEDCCRWLWKYNYRLKHWDWNL
jgi:hypothetical protein